MNRFLVRIDNHPDLEGVIRLSTVDEIDHCWPERRFEINLRRAGTAEAEQYEARFREKLGDLLALVHTETQGAYRWIPGGFLGVLGLLPPALLKRSRK